MRSHLLLSTFLLLLSLAVLVRGHENVRHGGSRRLKGQKGEDSKGKESDKKGDLKSGPKDPKGSKKKDDKGEPKGSKKSKGEGKGDKGAKSEKGPKGDEISKKGDLGPFDYESRKGDKKGSKGGKSGKKSGSPKEPKGDGGLMMELESGNSYEDDMTNAQWKSAKKDSKGSPKSNKKEGGPKSSKKDPKSKKIAKADKGTISDRMQPNRCAPLLVQGDSKIMLEEYAAC